MQLTYGILLPVGIVLLQSINRSFGTLVNHTIDDTNGDESTGLKPQYLAGFWYKNSDCEESNSDPLRGLTCSQNVDSSEALDDTWTGISINSTLSELEHVGASHFNLTFNGTAIYVFHIIPAHIEASESVFGLIFAIDDEQSTLQSYSKTANTQYNMLAFSREGLANVQHNLSVTTGSDANFQMIFDYAIYTQDVDSTGTTGPTESTGATTASESTLPHDHHLSISGIVGGVIGGIVALICVAIVTIIMFRRYNAKHNALVRQKVDLEPNVEQYTHLSSTALSGTTSESYSDGRWPSMTHTTSSDPLTETVARQMMSSTALRKLHEQLAIPQSLESERELHALSLQQTISGHRDGRGTNEQSHSSVPSSDYAIPVEAGDVGSNQRLADLKADMVRLRAELDSIDDSNRDAPPGYNEGSIGTDFPRAI